MFSKRMKNAQESAMSTQIISGWGNVMLSRSSMLQMQTVAEVRKEMASHHSRGVIARGLGRSYGDPAQNTGGAVLKIAHDSSSATRHNGKDLFNIEVDRFEQCVRVGAGVSIEQLLRKSIPLGLFVPVTPGTRYVTIGGAIASDVHGKNHHVDGSIGNHVLELTMLLSNGEIEVISPTHKPEWFWATVGGMGLTGIILEAVIRMIPIETHLMQVTTKRTTDLDSLLVEMTDKSDDDYRYSVAWIDLAATGKSLGRSVLTRGNHAMAAEINETKRLVDLTYEPKVRLSVPKNTPNGLLNSASVRAFNEMWYRKSPRASKKAFESISSFFHPLDAVNNWNRMYGSRGFMQYQCILPMGREDDLRSLVATINKASLPSFLAVLKRMGPSNPSPMSFGQEGWTLALDFPVNRKKLMPLISKMDDIVMSAEGRHYFAKDSHMTPQMVVAQYQRLDEWRNVCHEMDPDGVFVSDLSRRLQLRGRPK